ncbi:MAG: restriction endonuclease subunit S [Magnetococcales bacterium]|nr:restriction endonuclease subunit S [Magnetococcales bacterium]
MTQLHTVPLGSLVDIKGGGTPSRSNPTYWDGSIPWATVKDLNGSVLSETLESITPEAVEQSATNIIPSGNIVTATRMALGRAAINTIDIAINQDLKALFCKPEVDVRYLLHFLNANAGLIESFGKGATVKGITLDVLRQLTVPLPPLPEQKRIAAILDKADAIRRKRRQALALADQFLRAVFLDMFGDPVTNPNGFPIKKVQSVLSKERSGTQSGPFGSALKKHEYVSEGVPVWNIDNVGQNRFVPTPKLFIAEEKYEQLKRYSVTDGDILISRAGTVGRMCIAKPEVRQSIINTNLVRVVLDHAQLTSEYFVFLFTYCSHRLGGLRSNEKDNAFTFLNPKTLKALPIPVPPIDLQQKFIERVRQIEILTIQHQQQKSESTNLFQSLTQRAFRGEL